ncbi:hypothetical protein D3C78_1384940 [compost metagenome]
MAKLNTQLYIEPPAANIALNGFRVQMVTSTVRIRNGDQALMISPRLYGEATVVRFWPKPPTLAVTATLEVAPAICAPAVRFGCQTLRNRVRETRLARAEVMSGSSGPMKFEVKY